MRALLILLLLFPTVAFAEKYDPDALVSANRALSEARMLISLTGDVRISQIVNPLMTARVVMPILW